MGQWRQTQPGSQKFPRVATAVPVRITTVDPEIDPDTGRSFFRSAEETTANLSRGGAFVHSWEPLAPGRRVVIVIDLPDQGELQLVGQVAWTRRELRPSSPGELQQPGYGIEFTSGSAGERAALDRFLEELEPRTRRRPQDAPPPAPQI